MRGRKRQRKKNARGTRRSRRRFRRKIAGMRWCISFPDFGGPDFTAVQYVVCTPEQAAESVVRDLDEAIELVKNLEHGWDGR